MESLVNYILAFFKNKTDIVFFISASASMIKYLIVYLLRSMKKKKLTLRCISDALVIRLKKILDKVGVKVR